MFRRQCQIPEAQTVRSTSIGKQSQLPASSEDACLPLEPGRVLVELNAAVEGRRPEETPDERPQDRHEGVVPFGRALRIITEEQERRRISAR